MTAEPARSAGAQVLFRRQGKKQKSPRALRSFMRLAVWKVLCEAGKTGDESPLRSIQNHSDTEHEKQRQSRHDTAFE
jgi:hypothetical protein